MYRRNQFVPGLRRQRPPRAVFLALAVAVAVVGSLATAGGALASVKPSAKAASKAPIYIGCACSLSGVFASFEVPAWHGVEVGSPVMKLHGLVIVDALTTFAVWVDGTETVKTKVAKSFGASETALSVTVVLVDPGVAQVSLVLWPVLRTQLSAGVPSRVEPDGRVSDIEVVPEPVPTFVTVTV